MLKYYYKNVYTQGPQSLPQANYFAHPLLLYLFTNIYKIYILSIAVVMNSGNYIITISLINFERDTIYSENVNFTKKFYDFLSNSRKASI